jgi:hypothetical protein
VNDVGRRALSKEIDPQEMMRLREEPYCLSNREIAERLDVSYQTVWRYIGKTRPYRRKSQKSVDTNTRSKEQVNPPLFAKSQSISRFTANSGRVWELDVYNGVLTLVCGECRMPISTDGVHSMINELTYFEQVMNKYQEEHKHAI